VQDPVGADQAKGARRGPRIGLVVLVGVLVLLVGLMGIAVAGSNSRACSACHGKQTASLASSPHTHESCYQCHLDNGAWGMVGQKGAELGLMYPAAVLGRGLVQPARMTSRENCLKCHTVVLTKVTTSHGLRMNHATCAPGPTCDTCHSSVAHGEAVRWNPGLSMDQCIACHSQRNVSTVCTTCHLGDPGDRPSSSGAWQVVHGPNWRTTHGMGDQKTCGGCHEPSYCARCHGVPVPHPQEFGATHGAAAQKDTAACLVCHKSQTAFCDACHGMPMPHPVGFLKEHNAIAKGEADPRCIRCHVASDCTLCHANHVHPGASAGVPVPWTQTPEVRRP